MKQKAQIQRIATWYTYTFAVYMALIVLPTFWGYYMYSPLNTYWVIIPVWIVGAVLFWFAKIKWYMKTIIVFIWIPFTLLGIGLGLGSNMSFVDPQPCVNKSLYTSPTTLNSQLRFTDSYIYIYKKDIAISHNEFLRNECQGE